MKLHFALAGIALVASVVAAGTNAQAAERSGKEVAATCATCHATGANGAPKIGDKAAWTKLSERGLSSLTATVLAGIRKMPPHGGNMKLTDNELKRGVTYMVNQSGGNWVEPVSRTAKPVRRTGEQVVNMQCIKCHEQGKGGAPKAGDRDAWIPCAKFGLDPLVQSAINGHGGMPPRGGQANLTDPEIRDAIVYMFFNKGHAADTPSK